MTTSVLRLSNTALPPTTWLTSELNATRSDEDGGTVRLWFAYWPPEQLETLHTVALAPGLKVYCKKDAGFIIPEIIEIKAVAYEDQRQTLGTLTKMFGDTSVGKAILEVARTGSRTGLIQFDPEKCFGPDGLDDHVQRFFTELAGLEYPEPTRADFDAWAAYFTARKQLINARSRRLTKAVRAERLAWLAKCRQVHEKAWGLTSTV